MSVPRQDSNRRNRGDRGGHHASGDYASARRPARQRPARGSRYGAAGALGAPQPAGRAARPVQYMRADSGGSQHQVLSDPRCSFERRCSSLINAEKEPAQRTASPDGYRPSGFRSVTGSPTGPSQPATFTPSTDRVNDS
jgi:hypothetical protein